MPFYCCFCCISEVIVCFFSFCFLDYVQIKGTKIIVSVLQLVRNSSGRAIPDSNLIWQLMKDTVGWRLRYKSVESTV